jgi:hypothetical protein
MRISAAWLKSTSIPKFLPRVQALPLILLLAANLAVGLMTFQSYGLSWDEPLFYKYADSIGYAYSIQERLNGNFNLENAYGPSATDHKTYGPAYLLLAKPIVSVLKIFSPARDSDLWHLVNFLTFQIGLLFFYGLARYWVDRWAAFAATFFFATQPIVWGFAWINPKDVPFMVFFLGAMFFGMKMVDRLVLLSRHPQADRTAGLEKEEFFPGSTLFVLSTRMARLLALLKVISAAVFVLTVMLFLFRQPLENIIAIFVQAIYQASPDSLGGRLFGFMARQAAQVPVESYIHKSLVLFARLRVALTLLAALLVPAGLVALLRPAWIPQIVQSLTRLLAPLPVSPQFWIKGRSLKALLPSLLLAAVFLGLLSSIRVLGPLAGLLVALYFWLRFERRAWLDLGFYVLTAFVVMLCTWPYLWEGPLVRLWEVARHMSSNPQILSIVFNGAEYPSNKLPSAYLPTLLGLTLTEPTWLFFGAGLLLVGKKIAARALDWRSVPPLLLWFFLPFVYVILTTPPMYDGYRHFLFILPPIFLVAGPVFQMIKQRIPAVWANGLLLLVLAPGLLGIFRSHPYQYTYFNTLIGGTGGAFRQYETDFWLTCYRQIMDQVNAMETEPVTLFVHRQPGIAREYAAAHIDVRQYDADKDETFPGSLLLLSSRTGVDYKVHINDPVVYQAGIDEAIFCLIRRVE